MTCGNHGMRLWRPMTGEPARTLGDPEARADHGRLSADGRIAVSAGLRSVRVWDVESGDCLRTFEGPPGHPMTSAAVSADGRVVMTGNSDWNVRLWELDWDLDAREQVDWDDRARPHLEMFLRRYGRSWTAEDFDDLLRRLEHAGFGWLRADGVRAELRRMT